MRNSFFLGLLLVVLGSGSGAPNRAAEADGQAVAGEAALSAKDIAAIKTLHDAYQQAVLTGGLKATARFYADDAVLMARGPVVQGRAAFEKSLEGMSRALQAERLIVADRQGSQGLRLENPLVGFSAPMVGGVTSVYVNALGLVPD